jgi:SAM-dependent methyltransferase
LQAERARSGSKAWEQVSDSFMLTGDGGTLTARWTSPREGKVAIDPKKFSLYVRGDEGARAGASPEAANAAAAHEVLAAIARELNIETAPEERLQREEEFHDDWAASVRPEDVMVRESFESRTAPEHRFILETLGDLKGKKLLDLGSGLGEASVYFALKGAEVTACDLSGGMLDLVGRVAAHHKVKVSFCKATAEGTGLPADSFDVVYAGNLLHHVDLGPALDEIKRVLKPGGTFVTWDPLDHNPVINVYRRMAGNMRTVDEHPIKMSELALWRARFREVKTRSFWFSTLAVFLRFYFWERVHPSKERYWKKILTDSKRLEPFYGRLESIDRGLLKVMPFLSRYCWNIVIWGKK